MYPIALTSLADELDEMELLAGRTLIATEPDTQARERIRRRGTCRHPRLLHLGPGALTCAVCGAEVR